MCVMSLRRSFVFAPLALIVGACGGPAPFADTAPSAASALTDGGSSGGADAASDAAGDRGDGAAETVDAVITGFTFPPVSVHVGGTVRWTNASRAPHTVTSGASSDAPDAGALFDARLQPGGAFSFTFSATGDQPYFCRFHEGSGMVGVVHVLP
jgi:plastocyanin